MNRLDYMVRAPAWQALWGKRTPDGRTALEAAADQPPEERWARLRAVAGDAGVSEASAAALDIAYAASKTQVDIQVGAALQRFVLRSEPPGELREVPVPYKAGVLWVSTPHLDVPMCDREGRPAPDRKIQGFYMARITDGFQVFGDSIPPAPGSPTTWFFNVFGTAMPPEMPDALNATLSFSWGWEGRHASLDAAADDLSRRYAMIYPDAEYDPRDLATAVMRTGFGVLAYLATPRPDVEERRQTGPGKKNRGKRRAKPPSLRKLVRQNRLFVAPAPKLERAYSAARAEGSDEPLIGRRAPVPHWVMPHWRTYWVTPAHKDWEHADAERQNEDGKRPLRVVVGADTGGFLRGNSPPEKVQIHT